MLILSTIIQFVLPAVSAQRLVAHPPAQFITTQKTGGDCFGGRGRLAAYALLLSF